MAVRHLDPKEIFCFRNSPENEIYALEPTVLQDRDKRSAIIEDNVLLTEDGCVLISKRQTALIEIPYRTGEEA